MRDKTDKGKKKHRCSTLIGVFALNPPETLRFQGGSPFMGSLEREKQSIDAFNTKDVKMKDNIKKPVPMPLRRENRAS